MIKQIKAKTMGVLLAAALILGIMPLSSVTASGVESTDISVTVQDSFETSFDTVISEDADEDYIDEEAERLLPDIIENEAQTVMSDTADEASAALSDTTDETQDDNIFDQNDADPETIPGDENSENENLTSAVAQEAQPVIPATEDETQTAVLQAAEDEDDAEPEPGKPAFSDTKTADGVMITVSAPEGIFPESAYLSVETVPVYAQQMVDEAVENERDDDLNVAVSYTFDIKILGRNGGEIQPSDENSVKVSFALSEAADQNLDAQVYHISDDGDVQELDTITTGQTVEVQTDSFSYYTVEFTYNTLTYVLPGNDSVRLADILNTIGLTGPVSAVQSSNDALFSVSDASGEWIISALQSFTTDETLTVTINGIDYVIAVTDPVSYYLWVGGKQVTSENMDDILEDGGKAKYIPELQTLILENPAITGLRDEAQIYAYNINLIISGYATLDYSSAQYGIKIEGDGNLTIGVGVITAEGSKCGIYGTKTVNIGAATVNASGGENGIYVAESLVCNKSIVTASGKKNGIYSGKFIRITDGIIDANGNEYGISANNEISFISGSVSAEGSYYHGIYSKSNIEIDEDADVKAEGKQKGIFAEGNIKVYGKANVTGGEDGFYTKKDFITDGKKLKAEGQTGYGIYASDDINLTNDSLTATGYQAGIYSDAGNIYLKKGTITVKSSSFGIFSNAGDLRVMKTIDYVTVDGSISAMRGKSLTLEDEIIIQEPKNTQIAADTEGYQNIWNEDLTTAKHVELSSMYGVTVTFDTMGHGTAPESQFIKPGQKAVQPEDPAEEGYLFGGWYKDSGCTYAFNFVDTPVYEDTTLYAKWTTDPSIPIDKITIYNVTYPVEGEHPDTKSVMVLEEGVHMRGIGGWYWYDYEKYDWVLMEDTDTFDKSKTYAPFIYLNAEDGYRIVNYPDCTINGRAAKRSFHYGETIVLYVHASMPVASASNSLYVVTAGALNVRSDASYDAERIGGLKFGEVIQAKGQLNDWILIDYDGQSGWVNRRYLALTYSKETAIMPITYTVTGAGALNVRADISTDSKRIGGLTYSTEVLVTGIRTDGDGRKWLVMDYDGDYGRQLGYVLAKYTHTDGSVEFTYEEADPDTNENAKTAKEDEVSEDVEIVGTDPKVSMGGIVIWGKSAIAYNNKVSLNATNYTDPGDGTYYTLIYPDDAKNYSTLSKDNIKLPSDWQMSVMEMQLQDDGGIYLRVGPVNPVTVTFEPDNGEESISKVVSGGTTVSEPEHPVKEGFIFGGWYIDPACTREFDFNLTIVEDIILYAMWTEDTSPEDPTTDDPDDPAPDDPDPDDPAPAIYTIKYDLNGGMLDGKTGIVNISAEEGTTIILPKPAREGYTFDYWEGSHYDAGDSYKVEGDHTFTAQWKENGTIVDPGNTNNNNKPGTTDYRLPNAGANNSTPATGDNSHLLLYSILLAASLFGLLAIIFIRKRYYNR